MDNSTDFVRPNPAIPSLKSWWSIFDVVTELVCFRLVVAPTYEYGVILFPKYYLLINGLAVILDLVLLIGAYKNDMKKVRCWLMITILLTSIKLFITGFLLLLLLFFIPVIAIPKVTALAIYFGVTFYSMVVVKSFYTEQVAAPQQVTASQQVAFSLQAVPISV